MTRPYYIFKGRVFRHFGYMILLYFIFISDNINIPVELLSYDSLFQLIADMIAILGGISETSPSLSQDELILRKALQSLASMID